jgi:hypothetical protein
MNLNEPILPDDYPIHEGYLYVINDEVIESPITGTIKNLKTLLKLKDTEIRRCDIYGRRRMNNASSVQDQ